MRMSAGDTQAQPRPIIAYVWNTTPIQDKYLAAECHWNMPLAQNIPATT